LAGVPTEFRNRIVTSYLSVRTAFAEASFDTVGLRVGHFAESVIRLLQARFLGAHTPFGKKLPNFAEECARIERAPSTGNDEGVRVLIPRALSFVYTLRNKRGIGHVGGDVDPNEIDAATCARVADWCLCELIRDYRSLSVEQAQALIDALSVRQMREVWRVGGRRRVLTTGLSYKDQTLLLLYSEDEPVVVEDLREWVEYDNESHYARDVLRPLHRARLLEFDEDTRTVQLSPKGAALVEQVLRPGLPTQDVRVPRRARG
jgi:hypothetical protein